MKSIMERIICWRIPRLCLIKRGAVSWQDGGERSRPGKEPVITPEAKAWLVSLACDKAKEHGHPHELWTTRLLARLQAMPGIGRHRNGNPVTSLPANNVKRTADAIDGLVGTST